MFSTDASDSLGPGFQSEVLSTVNVLFSPFWVDIFRLFQSLFKEVTKEKSLSQMTEKL